MPRRVLTTLVRCRRPSSASYPANETPGRSLRRNDATGSAPARKNGWLWNPSNAAGRANVFSVGKACLIPNEQTYVNDSPPSVGSPPCSSSVCAGPIKLTENYRRASASYYAKNGVRSLPRSVRSSATNGRLRVSGDGPRVTMPYARVAQSAKKIKVRVIE